MKRVLSIVLSAALSLSVLFALPILPGGDLPTDPNPIVTEGEGEGDGGNGNGNNNNGNNNGEGNNGEGEGNQNPDGSEVTPQDVGIPGGGTDIE